MSYNIITSQNAKSKAASYIERGWQVVPVLKGEKRPVLDAWQNLRLTLDDLPKYFNDGQNVGVMLGEPSGWLVDVDLDRPEALRIAPFFLPTTNAKFGRASKQKSHWLYHCEGAKTTRFEFKDAFKDDPDGACIAELRSTGLQTVFPPSIHPSGEIITWHEEGEPARVAYDALRAAVAKIASCVLLARHYPPQGCRQYAAMALAGWLLRAGWGREEVSDFVLALAGLAGDEEVRARVAQIRNTESKVEADLPATGFPKLAEYYPQEVLVKVAEWLEIKTERERPRGDKEKTQAQKLVELAEAGQVEFFHTPDMDCWATVTMNGHKEHWPIKANGFRRYLSQKYYMLESKPPSTQAMQDALNVLEAKAQFEGPEEKVYTRLAERDGAIYLDLANDDWEAVEITRQGWGIVKDPRVKFQRAKGGVSLPYPRRGGSIDELRDFVNVPDEASWQLLVAFILACLEPNGPYPILLLYGAQGSAKSTTARTIKELVDPSIASLRSTPKDERDLAIAAKNSWVLAFDNVSNIPDWLSDAFCRLSSGLGLSTRKLFTDAEEALFSLKRPCILNGITEFGSRHDLIDRALILTLPEIPEARRRQEKLFWAEFEEAKAGVLGAFLDAVVIGLQRRENIKLRELPRMADFAHWIVSCEPALPWGEGEFMANYVENRKEAIETAIANDPVSEAVRELIELEGAWKGTSTALLERLEEIVGVEKNGEKVIKSRAWPQAPNILSNRLRRSENFLRAIGIELDLKGRSAGKKIIRITKKESWQDW